MAGHRNGVQQRTYKINKQALFVNCDNHSLNLVGVHAARQDTEMVSFFLRPLTHCTISFPVLRSVGKS